MSKALALTCSDLAKALASATYPNAGTHKRVIDEDTGNRVGHIMFRSYGGVSVIEWSTPHDGGDAKDEADALAKIEASILRRRASDAEMAARRAEIDALPEPIRSLTKERNDAALQLEIERQRNVRREWALSDAEDRFAQAELALAAAERELAEAA